MCECSMQRFMCYVLCAMQHIICGVSCVMCHMWNVLCGVSCDKFVQCSPVQRGPPNLPG